MKIRDGVYAFSFQEHNTAGTEGFFVMDLYALRDVGCFFGIIEPTHMTCAPFGARGEWTTMYTLSGNGVREAFDWESD